MYPLAIFPLNTVLFPGMPIRLHIFEARYRKMMRDCLEQRQPFGVVLIRRGVEANGPLAEPHRIGCSARIGAVEALADGQMNLAALGEERFRILSLNDEQPYLRGEVEALPLERSHSIEIMRGVRRLSPWVRQYLRLVQRAETNAELDLAGMSLPDDPLALLNLAAALLRLPAVEKQPLLEAAYAGEMLARLERLYRREAAVLGAALERGRDTAAVDGGVWLN